jgi:membrane-associated phospholipid phosphatase
MEPKGRATSLAARSLLLVVAVLGVLTGSSVLALAENADSAAADPGALPQPSPATWTHAAGERRTLLARRDAWFAAATVASVALATRLDGWAEDEVPENNGVLARDVSRAAERFGNPLYAVPLFLGLRAVDALESRSDRAASLVRIAKGAAAAGAAAGVVKIVVGRARPFQTPGDQDVIRPFSGNTSFPSGHATFAFGLAAAIDRETSARWVPWVVYPLAGLVGWSRIRDDQHWTSDVVAGAALGFWTARKVVDRARRGRPS